MLEPRALARFTVALMMLVLWVEGIRAVLRGDWWAPGILAIGVYGMWILWDDWRAHRGRQR